MKFKHNKNKKMLRIFFILILFFLNAYISIHLFDNNTNYAKFNYANSNHYRNNHDPETSAQELFANIPWVKNPDFSSVTINPWFNTTQGDSKDLLASVSPGQADYLVNGEEGRKEISNVFIEPSKWIAFNKSVFDNIPNNGYSVDTFGVNCSHRWSDPTANQIPKIYWRYNVSMGLDMSDYLITSVSIKSVLNASVNRNVDVFGDTIAAYAGDNPEIGSNRALNQYPPYDFVHFTVEVSDMEISQDNTYIIAENTTTQLGRYEGADIRKIESLIDSKKQEDIIFYLERVLQADTDGHDNFTIVLGISPNSADNTTPNFDYDFFDQLRIKAVNITFTYIKKIDISTSLSWNQIGNMINYTNVQVSDAKLNFKYKIDKNWTETTNFTAENSEFRVLINGNPQQDYPTIKLSQANNSFQLAREGGYDVKNLIPLKENITLSIQIFIGDDFILGTSINISIDDVYFVISYIVFTPDVPGSTTILSNGGGGGEDKVIPEPWTNLVIAIAAIGGAICIGTYLIAYQVILKYPKPVRKVRKYRRTLKRSKMPKAEITRREKAFSDKYKNYATMISNLKKEKFVVKSPVQGKFIKTPIKSTTEK